ncbi:MAG: MmcQ/YjbR family DNA-binding protein [Syntrophothermus sp.]
MNIEDLRNFCCSLPGVTEDIKWGNNLVFSVGSKMFCLADLDPPFGVAFKVTEEEFHDLTENDRIIQAPYFARMMWVKVLDEDVFSNSEWKSFLKKSYTLVLMKLPRKMREGIEGVGDG